MAIYCNDFIGFFVIEIALNFDKFRGEIDKNATWVFK